LFRFLVCPA